MERREYSHLREAVFSEKLACGLTVRVVRKPGYQKRYATFATRYGSIDNRFIPPGAGEPISVPDGIAHFLEHKLFEQETGGNIFERFAALGASVNAGTSYTNTTYLFSTSDRFSEALGLLLDFVQTPYFTPENVNKEKGIIAQEIRMYDDAPEWRLQDNLLRALYHQHPVRIDIAGTVDSIADITPEVLYRCYRTFYHPANMVLLVVGDVEPEAVIEQASQNLGKRNYQAQSPIERVYPDEPATLNEQRREEQLMVATPLLALGFKDRPQAGGAELLRRSMAIEIGLRALVGRSSSLYAQLYDEGLIDDSFGGSYSSEISYAHLIIAGETRDPERLRERLNGGLSEACRRGVVTEDYERIRRAGIGGLISALQSPELIAHQSTVDYFRGFDLFDRYDIYRTLQLDEVNQAIREALDPEKCAVSVVLPRRNAP
jgi:predicted Zn-dependent peptidase